MLINIYGICISLHCQNLTATFVPVNEIIINPIVKKACTIWYNVIESLTGSRTQQIYRIMITWACVCMYTCIM